MRDEQTNTRAMTCTWVSVTGADGRVHMEARWLGPDTSVDAPTAVPAHAA